jgi:hypothetical protein
MSSSSCKCDSCNKYSKHKQQDHIYTSSYREDTEHHLDKLASDMWNIVEWEQSIGRTQEDCVTFPKYLALKLTQQEIIHYMSVFNNCNCCSRHTKLDNLPDLPKITYKIDESDEPDACHCTCRHQLRMLAEALIIALY